MGSAKVLKSLPGYDETFTGLRSPGVGVDDSVREGSPGYDETFTGLCAPGVRVDDSVREGSPVYVESLGRTLWCCLHLPED